MGKMLASLPEETPLPNLSDRQRRLLHIVIQEYVKTAQPVGSNSIVQSHDLGVSSATIRNDLAVLEKEGLLTHPYTSAGRVPTDAGYRYFVQYLLGDSELSTQERSDIRMQFSPARRELDQWLRLSTAVLAKASQNAAVATAPRAARCRYKHMELVAIHGTKVLLVLVLQEGTVKQQLLDLDEPVEQSELSRVSNELNDHLAQCDATAIAAQWQALSPFARQVALLVQDTMGRIDDQFSGQIFRDGLVQILEAPEFVESDNVRKIVQVFEQRPLLEQILGEYAASRDIQVVIAGDGRFAELQDISLVIGRYGADNRATGVLGVIGPVRMSYGRTIGAVRFVATLMSEVVEEIVG
jgi:heat-inducible transcriptional repressor